MMFSCNCIMLALKPWTSRTGFNWTGNLFSLRRIRCSVQNFKEDKKVEFDISQMKIEATARRTQRPYLRPYFKPQRTKKFERKGFSTSPGGIYFQIIGCGKVDGSRSLLLNTGHDNYLFNCSEGTQRIAMEECGHETFQKISDIFLTSRTWKMLGGFPGVYLTVRGRRTSNVNVHGPEKCMTFFDTVKSFIWLPEFDVSVEQGYEIHEDTTVEVQKIPILYTGPKVIPIASKFGVWSIGRVDAITYTGVTINKSYMILNQPDERQVIDGTVIAYLVKFKSSAEQQAVSDCSELGTFSSHFQESKDGQDIHSGESKMGKANGILLQEHKEQKCLIIECPNEHYLESLLNNDKLNEDIFQDDNLKIVFHFTPKSVMQTESYKKWMNGFEQGDLKHILVNDQSTGVGNDRSKRHTKKLRMIAPSIFPKIWDECADDVHEEKLPDNIVIGQSGMQYHLDSKTAISTSSEILPFNEENIVDDIKGLMGESNLLEQGHNQMVPDSSKAEYPKITFIGTGSTRPNSYRNVSCILVETKPEHFILLDCGEGSVLQLYRHFGKTRGMDVLKKVKAVYLSHLHPDHHLGLVNMIQQRSKLLEGDEAKKLYIIAPNWLSAFLVSYDREFEPILEHAAPIRNEHLILDYAKGSKFKTQLLYPYILEPLLKETGLKSLYTSRAVHAPSSFCVAFTTDQNFKVVYTGDTRPNQALIDIGRHEKSPDLLIHEASVNSSELREAKRTRHSTFSEAIQDGEDMGARFTILTHFSKKCDRLVPFHELKDRPNVAVAFDHMSVNPQTFHFGRLMYPSLEKIFRTKEFASFVIKDTQMVKRLS